MGRKVLGAETRARDADPAERCGEPRGHAARIELDRMLGHVGEVERAPEPVDEVDEDFGAEDRRRAAAPMQVNDRPAADDGAQQFDFPAEVIGIGHDRWPRRTALVVQPQ
jgi:hypothetical protein